MIARLMKERDQARRDFESMRQAGPSAARIEVDNSLPGLDNTVHQKLNAVAKQLSEQRKTRVRADP